MPILPHRFPSVLILHVLMLLSVALPASAQQPDSSVARWDSSPFRRLELPAPNAIRTGSGAPGPEYWQQRVDYLIRASLDTVAQKVTGEERITYTNNSPDTLRYLWVQ